MRISSFKVITSLLLFSSILTLDAKENLEVENTQRIELCSQLLHSKSINQKEVFSVCGNVAKYEEKNKNFNSASWYYLVSGEFQHNVDVIQPLSDANYSYSNFAYSYALLDKNLDETKSLLIKFLRESPVESSDRTFRSDYDVLRNLYPKKRKTLKEVSQIWDELVKLIKPIKEVEKQYRAILGKADISKAISLLKEKLNLEINVLNENNPSLINTRLSLANAYTQNSQYNKSLEVLSILKDDNNYSLGESVTKAKVIQQEALNYQFLGEIDKAKLLFNQAVTISENKLESLSIELASLYKNIARFYDQVNDTVNALIYYDKLLQVYKNAGFSNKLSILPLQDKLAFLYASIGNHPKAIELYTSSLNNKENNLGKESLKTADSIDNLANEYQKIGSDKKVLQLFTRALKIREMHLKKGDQDLVKSLVNIANAYAESNPQNSINYYRKAYNLNKAKLGDRHKETVELSNKLAKQFQNIKKYELALKQYLETLSASEEAYGIDSLKIATIYNNLGEVYESLGNHLKALEYHQKALLIHERKLGRANDKTATSYNSVGKIQQALGRLGSAREYYSKALRVYDKKVGVVNKITATTFRNLGSLYEELSDYTSALRSYTKSLNIKKKILGVDALETAQAYDDLGALYLSFNYKKKALKSYKHSLAIYKKTNDAKSLVARAKNKLGKVYFSLGEVSKAIENYNAALVINTDARISDKRAAADNYYNLGLAYQRLGNTSKAIEFMQSSLMIRKTFKGDNLRQNAEIYYALAELFFRENNYEKALELHQNALELRIISLGVDDSATASSYSAIASIQRKKGDYKKSLNNYKKALEIEKTVFTEDHIQVADTYEKVALLYKATGEDKQFYQSAKKAFSLFMINKSLIFSALSSSQQREYLQKHAKKFAILLDATDILIKRDDKLLGNKGLIISTINDWLRVKNRLYDEENSLKTLTRNTQNKQIKSKIGQLQSSKLSLRKLYQNVPERTNRKVWSNNIAKFKRRIQILSKAIVKEAPRFEKEFELSKISLEDIASQLGGNQIYIDYLKTDNNYYLFSVDNEEEIQFVKFNESATSEIDSLIESFRSEITTVRRMKKIGKKKNTRLLKAIKPILAKLHERLLSEPLKDYIEEKEKLVVSVDRDLRMLPFETLFNESRNKYLIEEKQISYVPNGKEFIRASKNDSKSKIDDKKTIAEEDNDKDSSEIEVVSVIFSNPDFNLVTNTKNNRSEPKESPRESSSNENIHYSNLLRLKKEIKLVKKSLQKFGKVVEFTQEKATTINLIKVANPKYLHMATHCFFSNDLYYMNPMKASGIVLAGANSNGSNDDNGGVILSLTLSQLMLNETTLVTLPHCDATQLSVNSSSGINTLRKAYSQSGAKNIAISLWPMKTKKAVILLKTFYAEIKKGVEVTEALRKSKIELIEKKLHPYYWSWLLL